MARQNVNRGTTANDGTGDTLRVAAGKINDNFVELYTLLGGDSAQITQKVSLADSGVIFNGLAYNTVLGFVESHERNVLFLPDSDGTVITDVGNQTLTNKTITSPILTTPQINDTSADHQYIVAVSELAADRIITLPLLTGNDEIVFKDHTQTLTNKTFSSPNLTTPNITTAINDTNNAEIIKLVASSSATNEVQISNAAANGIPQVAATGTDTNVGLGLSGTAAGLVHIQSGVRFRTETISTNTAVSLERPVTIFEAGGALTGVTLANGSYVGEVKTFSNIGTGEVTITPTTFKNGTTLHLRADALVNCMWIDNTDGWLLMSPIQYASSDADALYYVT
tara:strand:- start:417 stop:1433 length:1017 start_codon:yes stop_codon:yes gene_type:complete